MFMQKIFFLVAFLLLLIIGYESIKESQEQDHTKPSFLKNYISKREIIDDITQLTPRLATIYERAQKEYSDELLKGLQPIEIFALDLHASQAKNYLLCYQLKNLVPGSTPDLDTYLKEISVYPESDNTEKFIQILKNDTKSVEEIIVTNKEAYIFITYKTVPNKVSDAGYKFYRIEKTQNGLWKMGFLSCQ